MLLALSWSLAWQAGSEYSEDPLYFVLSLSPFELLFTIHSSHSLHNFVNWYRTIYMKTTLQVKVMCFLNAFLCYIYGTLGNNRSIMQVIYDPADFQSEEQKLESSLQTKLLLTDS
jgi:hypothetical protein